MAGDWIKMQTTLPDKPEVWQMAGLLGVEADSIVGKLLRVWAWFDSHTENGVARASKALVDKQAGAAGFADAMVEAGWLVVSDQTVEVVSFEKHNGRSAKTRIATNQRLAKHRENARGNADETRRTLPRPIVRAVKDRDGNACVYCGRKEGEYTPPEVPRDAAMHIDHVIPLSHGGSDEVDNLACACGVCNLFKLNRSPDECGLKWPEVDGKRLGNVLRVTKTVTREEKRREEINTSVANATGGKPPSDRDLVFANGVTLLTAAGVTDKNARSFLAAQCKAHGEPAVLDALTRCAAEGAIQPVPWLQAALQTERAPPKRAQSFRERDLEAKRAEVAKWGGGLVADMPVVIEMEAASAVKRLG